MAKTKTILSISHSKLIFGFPIFWTAEDAQRIDVPSSDEEYVTGDENFQTEENSDVPYGQNQGKCQQNVFAHVTMT